MDNGVEVLQASTLNKFGFGDQYRRLGREDFAGQIVEERSSRVYSEVLGKVGADSSHVVLCSEKGEFCMIDPPRSQK